MTDILMPALSPTMEDVSGIAPDIAQTMVRLGIDLVRIKTVGDLQSGIEAAERLLGYTVVKTGAAASCAERNAA